MNARRKNKGWRFDYFLISSDLKDRVISCEILSKIEGSTHCPILMEIKD
jgi:exodeoxyribonuclease-3